jgi:Methylase involved in ubiquinone/menaquinone biosynthesis
MREVNILEDTRKYYGDEYYTYLLNRMSDTSLFQKYRIKNVIKLTQPKDGESILDLGTAIGTFAFKCTDYGSKVIGLDFSEESIKLCKMRALRSGYDDKNPQFIVGDATNMSFEDSTFDKVICADLTEHLYPEAQEKLIKECKRVLKNNGNLIIFTPSPTHIIDRLRSRNFILKKMEEHVAVMPMEYYENLLKEIGFIIEKSYFVNTHYPVISSIEKFLCKFSFLSPFFSRRICILARVNKD